MLTRSGWLTLLTAVIAAGAGRVFAVIEMYVVSGVLLTLAFSCLAWVRFTIVRVTVTRQVNPARVQMGETARVEIAAVNRTRAKTPVLHLSDPVAGTKGARLHLAPLIGDQEARAAYRLPTDHRGVIEIGPLSLEITDPFGIARRKGTGAPVQSITIYPHIDAIVLPALGGEEDPHGAVRQNNQIGRTSDEFFALRPYVIGDDLRRVHWKSSARSNDLMVRQDETPWQDRTTVALDVRPSAEFDSEAFERAVSAAASIAMAGFRRHHLVRLVSTDGFDSGAASGQAHSETILGTLPAFKCVRAPRRLACSTNSTNGPSGASS